MKKYQNSHVSVGILAFWAGFCVLFPCAAYGNPQPVAGFGQAGGPRADSAKIGVVAAVSGSVTLKGPAKVGYVVESGAEIFLGDVISTDGEGQLQILLKDQTVFTIGPNSSVVIDEFVYDPSTDEGKIHASIQKGVFRFITGKIARKKPENMNVDLPVGTIGVRGTIVAGQVSDFQSLVALLGPGAQNQTGDKQGSFILSNEVGNETKSTHVTRTGFGAEIRGGGESPSVPFKLSDSLLGKLTDEFTAPAPSDSKTQSDEEGDDLLDESDAKLEFDDEDSESGADDFDIVIDSFEGNEFNELLELSTEELDFLEQFGGPDSNTTTYEQLRSIDSSTDKNYTIDGAGTSATTLTKYDLQIDVDFGADTVGGGNSKITSVLGSGIGTFTFLIPSSSFATQSADSEAVFPSLGIVNQDAGGGACSGCTADFSVSFNNVSDEEPTLGAIDQIATYARHSVQIKNSGGTLIAATTSGSDVLTRNDGLSSP